MPGSAALAGQYLGIHIMHHDIPHILTDLINGTLSLRQVHFANPASSAPELAFQVDFPRLEIVTEGAMEDVMDIALFPGQSRRQWADTMINLEAWNMETISLYTGRLLQKSQYIKSTKTNYENSWIRSEG